MTHIDRLALRIKNSADLQGIEPVVMLQIEMHVAFEGFYGRASEDNEVQYTIKFREKEYKSQRYETLEDLAQRVFRLEGWGK